MKMKALMISLMACVALSACNKKEEAAVEQPAAAEQAMAQPAVAFPAARDSFVQDFESKLAALSPRVEAFKAQAAAATGEVKAKLEADANMVVGKVTAIQADVAAIKAATEANWMEVQARMQTAMGDVEASLAKAVQPAEAH